MRMSRRLMSVLVALLISTLGCGPGGDTARPAEHRAEDLTRIAERSLAHVRCAERTTAGVFVEPDLVLTSAQPACAEGGVVEVVQASGRLTDGRIVVTDEWFDVALVRVPGVTAEPLAVADGAVVEVGEPVACLGGPSGLDFALTVGSVASADRVMYGTWYLSLGGPAGFASSGGPVVDTSGRLIAVVSSLDPATPLALPVNYLLTGSPPLLGQTATVAGDEARWRARLEAAERVNREQIAAAVAGHGRLGLVRGRVIGTTLSAYVDQWGETVPDPVPLHLVIVNADGGQLCTVRGFVDSWRPAAADLAQVTAEDRRRSQWLERSGVVAQRYLGQAQLDLHVCPPSRVLRRCFLAFRDDGGGSHRVPIT